MRQILTIAVALTVAGSLVSGADWPRYRGPAGDGVAEVLPLEKLALTPVWKVAIGDSFGQIAVVGKRAFVMAERGADEYCVALDAATGKEVWAVKVDKTKKDGNGNGPRSTPTIDGKYVYVFSSFLNLVCLDLETGKELWRHDLVKENGARVLNWASASSPVVVDDLIVVTGGGAGKGISAYKKEGGDLVWAKTNEAYTYATPTIATIKGVKQVICFMESGLVSVDPKTGEVLWTFAHPKATATAASPVVGGKDGDIVYCSAGYNVGAAACQVSKDGDKWTAKELWRTKNANMNLWSTPVHKDGYVYGLYAHNDPNGPLACLNIATGEVKWSQKGFGSQGGLILVGDKLLVQTPKGDIVAVAATSDAFKEIGRVTVLASKDWTAPTLANGMVYARNTSGTTGKGSAEITCLKVGE